MPDGKRILIDRLWPRGIAKDRARLFSWCREIAPSDGFCATGSIAHPERWDKFAARYRHELEAKAELTRELASYAKEGMVTLLFASRNEEQNNAVVLRDVLRQRIEDGMTKNA